MFCRVFFRFFSDLSNFIFYAILDFFDFFQKLHKNMKFDKSLKIQKSFFWKTAAEHTFRTLYRLFGIFFRFFEQTSKNFKMAAISHTNINFGFPELKIWKWLLANWYIWGDTFLESNIDLDWTGPLTITVSQCRLR